MTIEQRIRAQAAKTAEEQIERSAKMYEQNPRLLDLLYDRLSTFPPHHLNQALLTMLHSEMREMRHRSGFGGEVSMINLKGALRYVNRLIAEGK